MPDILFADVSNYQSGEDWLPAYRQACGVIAEQVSWGLTVTTPDGRVADIRAQKFDLVIWYMGLRADQDVTQQVLTFFRALGPLQPWETVCLDWEETPGAGTPTVKQRDNAVLGLAFCYRRNSSTVGTYGSASLLAGNPPPLGWVWSASYETPEPPGPHVLWQFTNGAYTSYPAAQYSPVNWPGVGAVDTSVFHGGLDEMRAALSTVPPPAPPAPTPPPSQEDDLIPHQLTLPGKLDANGNGWYSAADLGVADVNKIVSIAWIVGTPTQVGYQKVPDGWGIDADEQVVVEGGTPG